MKKIILFLVLSFYSNAFSQVDSGKPEGELTTTSYYVGKSNNCYDIWVGIFSTKEGQKLLVASGIVHLGYDKPIQSNRKDSKCKDVIYKGDYIENSTSKEFKYCLIECLKYDDVYAKFESDKYRILSTIKK
jgi:hypothetical protein